MKSYTSNFRILLTLLVIVLLSACGSGAEKSGEAVSPQTLIENASFVTLDGERVSVSDFPGKVVLVDFWETWCVPCLQAMPTFQQVLEEYPDVFVVLAVSPGWSDTPEDVKRFKDEYGYDFIWVFDEDEVAAGLQIAGIPYKVFIDPEGKYITTELGAGGHQREYSKIVGILEEQFNR
jgi:thiol-disulfide isomerase/thioredoxin